MPSESAKQHRFMAAVEHNQAFAKKVGVPQKVGADFVQADKGGRFDAGDYQRKHETPVRNRDTRRGH